MILTRLAGISVVDSVESITAALNGFNKAALTPQRSSTKSSRLTKLLLLAEKI